MLLASSPISASVFVDAGLLVVWLVLFAETGLLIGFFLPGDSLLLLAGYHTLSNKSHHLDYWTLSLGGIVAAIVGAQVGYLIGRQAKHQIFDSHPSRQHRLTKAHKLLQRFGDGPSCLVARFIPVVRTFMPPLLGAVEMNQLKFLLWNIAGAILWVPSVIALGRLLPKGFPIDKIVVGIIILGLLLPVVEWLRHRRRGSSAV